jgi:hypothetical protein
MVSRLAFVLTATLGIAACGDARLDKLSENITRDSTLKILAQGAAGDTAPHIYREDQYLVDGKWYKVSYYTPTDRKQASDSAQGNIIADDKLTPLVFVNDTLQGWGWERWEQVAATINVPVPPRK